MTMRALEAAELLRAQRIDVGVLHVPTIKPLDEATIIREASEDRASGRRRGEPHCDRRAGRSCRGGADACGRAPGFQPDRLPDEFLDAGALPTLHDRYGISTLAMAEKHQAVGVRVTTAGFIGLGAMGLPMARNLVAARGAGPRLRHAPSRDRGARRSRRRGGFLGQRGGGGCRPAGADGRQCRAGRTSAVRRWSAGGIATRQHRRADGHLPAGFGRKTVRTRAVSRPPLPQLAGFRRRGGGQKRDADDHGGGPSATFAAAKPVLQALGDKIFHVGERPGQGAVVKTVNQLLCGVHIAVVAEAFSLAARVGVDLKVMLEILGGSSASSWMLKDRGPRMLEANPEVTSAVDIFVKDLGIVLEAGRETKAPLPLAALAHQLFLATSGRGDGAADDSQVIRSYFALNGQLPP